MSNRDEPRAGRLVSFLGTGDYQPVRYRLDERTADESCWVVQALCQLCDPPPGQICLMVTPESEKRVPEVAAVLEQNIGLVPETMLVPSLADPAAQWQQFQVLKEALRTPDAMPVILDITHGFRSQPFFAAAVAAFVRAVDADPPPLRILYGAFEARDNETGIAPVWDLTAFVELLDWAREIMLFLRTGRAAEVAARTETLDRAVRRAWFASGQSRDERPRLDALAKALAEFGGDLETIRTGALLLGTETQNETQKSSATRLLDSVDVARRAAQDYAPPLADVLDRIETMTHPLRLEQPSLGGEPGHRALAALSRLYYDMARYADAISVIREGWITRYGRAAAQSPGFRVFDDNERRNVESRWRDAEGDRARVISGLRNDIEHAGFRSHPKPANTLFEEIGRLVESFEMSAGDEDTAPPRVFANISNHPSSEWSEEQRRVALAYADRIEDVPFPAVPPTVSQRKFDKLLKETLHQVPLATTHAMVQGEFTLTFALVKSLQHKKIACYAATGDRDTETSGNAKLSRFDFAGFREFPTITGR